MQAEEAIILGQQCSLDNAKVMHLIPELSVDDIALFLTLDKTSNDIEDEHVLIARSILDNRYSYTGWKDYIYCCIETWNAINGSGMDTFLDYIMEYVAEIDEPKNRVFQRVISIIFSIYTVMVDPGTGSYGWKCFSPSTSTWKDMDKSQIWEMVKVRSSESKIGARLSLSAENTDRCIRSIKARLPETIGSVLFCARFNQISDSKSKVFVTGDGSVYDIKYRVIRRGLPSDMSTLRSDHSINIPMWRSRRNDMLDILDAWLSGSDVSTSYMEVLSDAVGEFQPRYAIVNFGTGSDGKSTFMAILKGVFGGYSAVCPPRGPAIDTRNANDATPLANSLVKKRICFTNDCDDVARLIQSAGFKSISGGDSIYRRAMRCEAEKESERIKLLCMVCTNKESMSSARISYMTRIKAVHWCYKTIDDNDRRLVPSHNIEGAHKGISDYETKFLREYGDCLLTEIIVTHKQRYAESRGISLCDKILEWTKQCITPHTMAEFLLQCTEPVNEESPEDIADEFEHMALTSTEDISRQEIFVPVLTLYHVYLAWKKTYGKMERSDPNIYPDFREHVGHFHKIQKVVNVSNIIIDYIQGLRLTRLGKMLQVTQSVGGRGLDTASEMMADRFTNRNYDAPRITETFDIR